MADREQIRRHLENAAAAFGDDLPLPAGHAAPRERAAAPEAAPEARVASTPAPAPSPPPPPALRRPTSPAPLPAATPPDAAATEGSAAGDSTATALAALRAEVLPCTKCKLHTTRTTVVFGEGNPRAEVMFLGEAPGMNEDRTGRPFVGAAGQLLDRILENAMGMRRDEVYIANVNKCRPPGNRQPEADEVAACLPFLRQQIGIVKPKVLVCLGRTAAQSLLGTTASTTALRTQTLTYLDIPVVVTWHPAYLLRDPSHKRETWDDIKRVNRLLGRPEVPPRPTP